MKHTISMIDHKNNDKKNEKWYQNFGTSVLNFFYKFDKFGDSVEISYKGRTSHPSAFGGFLSLSLDSFLGFYFLWRVGLFAGRSRDDFGISEWTNSFIDIGPQPVQEWVNFAIYINDEDFDNFDNDYAQIKLHRYTNMET